MVNISIALSADDKPSAEVLTIDHEATCHPGGKFIVVRFSDSASMILGGIDSVAVESARLLAHAITEAADKIEYAATPETPRAPEPVADEVVF